MRVCVFVETVEIFICIRVGIQPYFRQPKLQIINKPNNYIYLFLLGFQFVKFGVAVPFIYYRFHIGWQFRFKIHFAPISRMCKPKRLRMKCQPRTSIKAILYKLLVLGGQYQRNYKTWTQCAPKKKQTKQYSMNYTRL